MGTFLHKDTSVAKIFMKIRSVVLNHVNFANIQANRQTDKRHVKHSLLGAGEKKSDTHDVCCWDVVYREYLVHDEPEMTTRKTTTGAVNPALDDSVLSSDL